MMDEVKTQTLYQIFVDVDDFMLAWIRHTQLERLSNIFVTPTYCSTTSQHNQHPIYRTLLSTPSKTHHSSLITITYNHH
jgi:hypothetical protein